MNMKGLIARLSRVSQSQSIALASHFNKQTPSEAFRSRSNIREFTRRSRGRRHYYSWNPHRSLLQFPTTSSTTSILFFNQRSLSSDEEKRSAVISERSTSECLDMSQQQHVVGHDSSENYFYILLENKSRSGPIAKLEYSWIRPNLVDLYHTEVPVQFQGQGIAKILAKAAFDFFSEKEVTIRPSCTYLQKYLRDNPIANYLDHIEREFAMKIKESS